jgi:hypothetical protein
MPWSFIIPAAVSLYSSNKQAGAAQSAADTSAAASDRSAQLQKQMFDEQMRLQEPYRAAGITGQNRLMELMGLGGNAGAAGYGKYSKDFGMQDFQQDPGYSFRLSEGLKGLDRSAAARGGLISGGALKAATQYGQEMGSQEYQNAFNRYQTNRTNQLQPLGNLMASGQSAASNQGAAAGQYGSNVGNIYQTQGVNQGNALMAGNQARTSAYGDIAKLYGSTKPNFNNLSGSNSMPEQLGDYQ